MIGSASRSRQSVNTWPGFVDALASVLLVFIFMLMLFVLAQFYLSDTLAGREKALDQLTIKLNELADTLSLERDKNAGLELEVEDLSARLQVTLGERDALEGQLKLVASKAVESAEQASSLEALLKQAQETVTADKETIRLKLLEIASLQDDIVALRQLREEMEARIAEQAGQLGEQEDAIKAARDRSKMLAARLSTAEETTLLAQVDVDRKDIRIRDLSSRIADIDNALLEEKELSERAQSQVALLNQQIASLRQQLSRLSAALDLSETQVQEQKLEIGDLGQKLNLALAAQVQELSRYRSDFFGRLREVLGDHPDIRVVGDRFLFQSELLFASGSADLGGAGKNQLRQLAITLNEIATDIPEDIEWVLRIDGHTDARPIRTRRFPSNWVLSTARAVSIVDYLISQGVPPNRLAATGFGEHRPLDSGETLEAYSRNRRIEMKLTQP